MQHSSIGSRIFDLFNYVMVVLLAVITLYPFWDSLVVSVIPMPDYLAANIHLFPRHLTFAAYQYLFRMQQLWTSYGITIFITVAGSALNMLITVMAAYALSKRELKGQKIILFLIIITMMFSGGIIPTYLVVRSLGLMNSVWAMIIPSAINTYNLIILKNFFSMLPDSLEDSARMDGCNDIGVLFKIVIPLSMPAIATISLFYAVAHWNEFFTAVFYISDARKWPLQLFLRAMLFENESTYQGGGNNPYLLGVPIKMATVMIATIPVMLVYPFFQKYFVKGVTIGAVKE